MSAQGWAGPWDVCSALAPPAPNAAGCLSGAVFAATRGWRKGDLPVCRALCSSDFSLLMNLMRFSANGLPFSVRCAWVRLKKQC